MHIFDYPEYIALIIIVIAVYSIIRILSERKDKWVSQDDFERQKKNLRPNLSEEELQDFIDFLKEYKGGFVKRRSGQIVYQDFTGKEKGDLKGIFWNIVFPSHSISVKQKENFRNYLRSLGVIGLDNRPQYETRDSKLTNKKEGEEFQRKEVGNIGEKIVRDVLEELKEDGYLVINGPKLEYNDVIREYDHIIIGYNGVFCIETKAFGMSEGKSTNASLFIDPGDKWILRRNKTNREVESPTEQILSASEHLENIISDAVFTKVYPILVLSNSKLYVKNNIKLKYDLVRVDELISCIKEKNQEYISEIDKMSIAMSVDKHRKN